MNMRNSDLGFHQALKALYRLGHISKPSAQVSDLTIRIVHIIKPLAPYPFFLPEY